MTTNTQTQVSAGMDVAKKGLPVTIITGFLGSGKTTLLNHILTNQDGIKTAVLVNEFGEIGIDNDLIISTDDNMVELNNGCVCCTINEDLVNAVYKILEREDKIDYLVVETTGLADPLPVARIICDENFELTNNIFKSNYDRIILFGCGSSYNLAVSAAFFSNFLTNITPVSRPKWFTRFSILGSNMSLKSIPKPTFNISFGV